MSANTGAHVLREYLLAFFLTCHLITVAVGETQQTYDVTEYGAVGDGETVNTEAINNAITDCAGDGGGTVVVPEGTFMTGSVILKSNVTLKLAEGARLAGTDTLSAYRYLDPSGGRIGKELKEFWNRWHRGLILGNDVENVTIEGPGVIDGRHVYDPNGEEEMRGPHTVLIGNSSNVTVRDVHVKRSANYAVFFRGCEEVMVRETRVTGGWDAVHFRDYDGTINRKLRIEDSKFYTGDDCIAGSYVEGLGIQNCYMNSSCNGIRIIGPVRHMSVTNCEFRGPGEYPHRKQERTNMLAGILLQPGAWDAMPGPTRDVSITGVNMEKVTAPVQIWLKRDGNTLENVRVRDLEATGVYRSPLSIESWSKNPVRDVRFENIDIQYAYEDDPEKRKQYEAGKPHVGARPLPAWGVFAKHVNGLQLKKVRMRTAKADPRPATIFRDVENLERQGMDLEASQE